MPINDLTAGRIDHLSCATLGHSKNNKALSDSKNVPGKQYERKTGAPMMSDGVMVRYGQADRAYENEFFRYFAKSIKAYFDKKGIQACLLGMPTCLVNDRLQIDALLVTQKTITIIDFKDYGGTLLLPQKNKFRNGPWEMDNGVRVKGGSSPNPFYQTGLQRERLSQILKWTCRNRSTFNANHISTMVCFQQTVLVQGSIPGNYRPYFHIADADTFLEKVFDIVSSGRDDAGLLEPEFIDYLNKKVFETTPYDLNVTPESLGITRAEGPSMEPTIPPKIEGVQEAAGSAYENELKDFFCGESSVLIVSGTTGSGKTSLVPLIRSAALETGFTSARVFGLSNRVICNLLSTVDEVESLYSAIFDFSATTIAEDGSRHIPLSKFISENPFEDLAEDDEPDARSVFIICEAQMVTNSRREDKLLKFGSGRLLSDLLKHLGIGTDGKNKVVFVGDKFELSFGSWSESCLNVDWYLNGIAAEEIELPDTSNPSGIQSACIDIANAIRSGRVSNLVLEPSEQIRICEPNDEMSLLKAASDNWCRHRILVRENKQAARWNGLIKQKINASGSRYAIGDVVVFDNQVIARQVVSTNTNRGLVPQFCDQEPRRINAGDFAAITSLNETSRHKIILSEKTPHQSTPVELTLIPATVRLESSRASEEYEIYFIEELLTSDDAKLTDVQEMALQIHLKSLMAAAASATPFEKSPQYAEMVEKDDFQINERGEYRDKNDGRKLTIYEKKYRAELQKQLLSSDTEYFRWFNAARLKYGWCMTTHKAMAYTFNEVTFSPNTDGGRANESYLRFLYTGISRARERVNLVRWIPISPFEKTVFGMTENAVASKKRPAILISTKENVSTDIRQLVQNALPAGASVVSEKSSNYQEIFEIQRRESIAKVIFDYSGDARVKPPRRAAGDMALFTEFKESIERLSLSDDTHGDSDISWLYSFIQEKVLPGYPIQLESSSAYSDVVRLQTERDTLTIRVDHRKDGAISYFRLLSGNEEAYWKVVAKIQSFYCLGND